MKAVRYYGIEDVRAEETEKPSCRPHEVLIKVNYAGLCGSDLHIYRKGMFVVDPPKTMGHEVVGAIAEIGEAVTGFMAGDIVVVDPRVPCGECISCQSGNYNICRSLGFIGEVSPGCFAEYLAADAAKLIKVPAKSVTKEMVLAEPLAVALHICSRMALRPQTRLAVVGAGPIGLLTIAAAKSLYQVQDVTAVDLSAARLSLAKQAGASAVRNDFGQDREFDVIVEAAGAEVTFNRAVERLSDHGVLYVVSIFEKQITIDPNMIVGKEISVVGSNVYTTAELQQAVALIAAGKIHIDFLITNEFPLEEGKQAFLLANSQDKTVAKIIFKPD